MHTPMHTVVENDIHMTPLALLQTAKNPFSVFFFCRIRIRQNYASIRLIVLLRNLSNRFPFSCGTLHWSFENGLLLRRLRYLMVWLMPCGTFWSFFRRSPSCCTLGTEMEDKFRIILPRVFLQRTLFNVPTACFSGLLVLPADSGPDHQWILPLHLSHC